MLRQSLILSILITIFTGCFSNQKNVNYKNHFFIMDKRLTLQKEDIKDIKYIQNDEGTYNVDLILKKRGLNKLKYLFKNSEGKHFALIVNNKVIQFNKEEVQYFLNSFGVKFKE